MTACCRVPCALALHQPLCVRCQVYSSFFTRHLGCPCTHSSQLRIALMPTSQSFIEHTHTHNHTHSLTGDDDRTYPFFSYPDNTQGAPIVRRSEIRNPRTHESECERGDLLSSLQVHAILDGRSTCISCDSVGQCIKSLVVESGAFDMYEYRRRVVGDGEEQTPHIRPFTSISFHAQEFAKKK